MRQLRRREIYALVLFPVAAAAGVSFFKIKSLLDEAAAARRHEIATLAATALNEKFGRLSDIGSALATRIRFTECVESGRWGEAIGILKSVPETFPFVDRVFLADPQGTIKADAPALPGVVGRNFAYRDWYLGVRASGKPYISEVYRRAAKPQYLMIALAVPVRGKGGALRGILVLQVRAGTLLDWINDLPVGGEIEIVDQRGHPASRRAAPGDENLERRPLGVAARAEIPKYGWSVVARAADSGPAKRVTLRILLAVYTFLFLLTLALARALARTLEDLQSNQAELTRARDEALATARFKSEFVATVSHELRTPLNAIIGLSEMLLDSGTTPAQREDLRSLRAAGDVLLKLVNDILDFSKLEAGMMTVEAREFDPRASIERATDLLRGPARAKGLRLGCSISDDVPRAVRGDARRLEQILTNLLSNAVKFTERGGVALAVRKEFETASQFGLVFEVSDTGIGIEPEKLDRVFQAFVQADASTTRKYGGTGLGLSISRMLAETMGGELRVESAEGRGSIFRLRLPFRRPAIAES